MLRIITFDNKQCHGQRRHGQRRHGQRRHGQRRHGQRRHRKKDKYTFHGLHRQKWSDFAKICFIR
jgi:hypothetical protein